VRLRACEWLLAVYFAYVALISPAFPLASWITPWLIALLVPLLFALLARGEHKAFHIARDWLAVSMVLVAYREMDLFSATPRDLLLEHRWVEWDRAILYRGGLQQAIESLGAAVPMYLELSYLFVYAVAPFVVATLYVQRQLKRVDGALFLYLLGTLAAYALFPFFPSDPPRVAFGASDLPNVTTPLRELNLWLVGNYGIHSSVFPSAHVSSAFSAAWALLAHLPERRRFGWGMLVYAVSVAVATVYGRYHYAADAVAGLAVSLVPVLIVLLGLLRLPRGGLPGSP